MLFPITPLALCVLSSPAPVQESGGIDPAADPAKEAADLVRTMAKRDLVFEGEATVEDPPEPDDEGGAGGIVFGGPGYEVAGPFEGLVEFASFSTGERLISSSNPCPGFVLYTKGKRHLRRMTYGDEAPELGTTAAEWDQLLDLGALAVELEQSEITARVSAGRTVYSGKLRPDWIKPAELELPSFGIVPPSHKVLELHVELVVDAAGAASQLVFRVQRNDPLAELSASLVDNAGGGLKKGEHVLGETSHYAFHLIDAEPTERSRRALEEFRALDRELGLQGK